MSTRKVFISAGHGNVPGKDMGAESTLILKEGQLTVELRKLVISELKTLNVYAIDDPDPNITKDTVQIINATLTSKDVAVDIHFNWFIKASAKGTEVLIPFKSSIYERELAKKLCAEISNVLKTTNRGVKTEAESAIGRLLFMTPKCENILIEVCFLSNLEDIMSYFEKKNEVAKVIADCIYNSITN